MRPRKRIKDLYQLIENPPDDDESNPFKLGNIDLNAAI